MTPLETLLTSLDPQPEPLQQAPEPIVNRPWLGLAIGLAIGVSIGTWVRIAIPMADIGWFSG